MIKKSFTLWINGGPFRKWDYIAFDRGTALVIDSHLDFPSSSVVTYKVIPYKTPRNKFVKFIKFNLLRISLTLHILS